MKPIHQDAFNAVNKFLFYSWNYKYTTIKALNQFGEKADILVPDFIAKVKWTFDLQHAIEKWNYATDAVNNEAYLPRFYQTLDITNRESLVEWIIENYKG